MTTVYYPFWMKLVGFWDGCMTGIGQRQLQVRRCILNTFQFTNLSIVCTAVCHLRPDSARTTTQQTVALELNRAIYIVPPLYFSLSFSPRKRTSAPEMAVT